MPLQIETRPIREIDENNLSKWNAAFSPVIYTGIRRDVGVTSILSGTSTQINVFWLGTSSLVPIAGDTIYLCSGPYDGQFEVLIATPTLMVLETPFISQSYGGFIDLNLNRANHHVNLELYRIVNSAYVLLATMTFRTQPDGRFSFDLSALLRRAIKFVNDYDYITINKRDTNVSGGFNFRYEERFQRLDGSQTGISFSNFDEKDVTYYVGAARQLKDKFGSNMAQFVPNPGSIDIFNGNFDISDPTLDGWSNVDVDATSQISGGILMYSSGDDAGVSTWTSDQLLTNGVDYEVIVDKILVEFSSITIIAGTNEVTLSALANKEKINITANGTAFKIRFNSLVAPFVHQVQLQDVQVYLSDVPQPARFLVDEFEPTYFKDFPFDLPFIHSDNLVDLAINRNRRFFDQNNVEISVSIDALDVSTNDFAVNRMIVGAVPPGTKCIDVWLDVDASVRTGYVEIGYVGDEGLDGYTSGTQTDNPTTQNPQTETAGDVVDRPIVEQEQG